MYQARTLRKVIEKAVRSSKIVVVTGFNQVGKTTLLKELAADGRRYITLDDAETLDAVKKDPCLLLSSDKLPLFIDDIQYAPEVLSCVKTLADISEEGQIWLAGYRQFLKEEAVSALSGQVTFLELYGLSLYERESKAYKHKPFIPSSTPNSVLKRKDELETFDVIWNGSFPGFIRKKDSEWSEFYSSYVKTYIERNVRRFAGIDDSLTFHRFMREAARRTGQEVSLSDIAQNLDVPVNIIRSWMSALQASGIVYTLPPYHDKMARRATKRSKMYFMDTGLVAYLIGCESASHLLSDEIGDAVFQTFVFGEIMKSYVHNGLRADFYYYRDTDDVEVNLIIVWDGKMYPVEIRKTAVLDSRMVKHFEVLEKLTLPVGYGSLVCLSNEPFALTRNVSAISLWDM